MTYLLPRRLRPALALAALTLFAACDAALPHGPVPDSTPTATLTHGEPIPGHYIVVMNGGSEASLTSPDVHSFATQFSEVSVVFESTVRGFAGPLAEADVERLRADPRVAYVEPDRVIAMSYDAHAIPPPSEQEVPYGVTRVNGGARSSGSACVIDTGVDLDHPDLNVDTRRSRSFIRKGRERRDPNDLNGHGTHVAGIIGALDNEFGVVGVAAGATIVAVKVLDQYGGGSYSNVIAGLDYVASGRPRCSVANLSLGGPASQALDDAVLAAGAAGVTVVLAAGNHSRDASTYSPMRAAGVSDSDNVYAISAVNSRDRFMPYSNYGPVIAYAAPGAGITSTWAGGGYRTAGGTSSAAPHAAGVFLLGAPRSDGAVRGDPDGNPDPVIVH